MIDKLVYVKKVALDGAAQYSGMYVCMCMCVCV